MNTSRVGDWHIGVDGDNRLQDSVACGEQSPDCAIESGNPTTDGHPLLGEARTEPARQSDPERHRQSAYLIFEGDALPDQLLARDNECANGM